MSNQTVRLLGVMVALLWLEGSRAGAVEIAGTVSSAKPEYATVTTESDFIPMPGDKAEIFFKVPGADEEISVATGTVTAVDANLAKIKVVNATGTIQKTNSPESNREVGQRRLAQFTQQRNKYE